MIQHQPFYPYPYNFQQTQQQKPQTGFVVVGTEDEALRYPIAPGTSITFKVESQPIMLEKTMGFSQLDSPQVKRYRIVEEDAPAPVEAPNDMTKLAERIDHIEEELDRVKSLIPKKPIRKKEGEDE